VIQDDFYKAIEANSFFNRNEPRSSDSFPRPSKIAIQTFIDSDVELRRGDQVLEIGCFIGDLLAEYRKKGMLVHGIEPSQNACAFALRQFSIDIENVAFSQSQFFGFDPQHEGRFNLVILDDVLGWVDRSRILQSLAAIDWLVPKNGHIFIRELYSDTSYSVPNHHHPGEDIRNYRHAHGHHQLLVGTGQYAVVKMHIRPTNQFQRVESPWHRAVWADVLLQKLPVDSIPIIHL